MTPVGRERRLYDTATVAPPDAELGPGCRCRRPLVDDEGDCCRCGRPIRLITAWARELRYLSYGGALEAAAGLGLDRATGFRGLSPELGPNPEMVVLHAALEARISRLHGVAPVVEITPTPPVARSLAKAA